MQDVDMEELQVRDGHVHRAVGKGTAFLYVSEVVPHDLPGCGIRGKSKPLQIIKVRPDVSLVIAYSVVGQTPGQKHFSKNS